MILDDLVARVPDVIDAALVHAMQHGMDYADAQEIRWAVLGQRTIAWCSDQYAGASCPLRAAGFTRAGWGKAWDVEGGAAFERAYDNLMCQVVLPGPGMVGLPKVAA